MIVIVEVVCVYLKIYRSLEMSGDMFFKAGENVTEVNLMSSFIHT